MLSEKDIKLLQKAINEKENYKITVDNDSIILEEKRVIEDTDEEYDEFYADFDNFGQDFIVDLLQYLGADADYC